MKENQGQLYEGIQDLFEGAEAWRFDGVPYDHALTLDKGHGRVERRECCVITDPDCLNYLDPQGRWSQLKAAVRVVGHRQTAEGSISQPRYYISSLAGSAEQLLAAVRSHWSIENSLHWTLDVTFREDQCRVRKDHGPQNVNILRQIGHNLLKNERTLQGKWAFRANGSTPDGMRTTCSKSSSDKMRLPWDITLSGCRPTIGAV